MDQADTRFTSSVKIIIIHGRIQRDMIIEVLMLAHFVCLSSIDSLELNLAILLDDLGVMMLLMFDHGVVHEGVSLELICLNIGGTLWLLQKLLMLDFL